MLSAGGKRPLRCRGRVRLVQQGPREDCRHDQRLAGRRRTPGQDGPQLQESQSAGRESLGPRLPFLCMCSINPKTHDHTTFPAFIHPTLSVNIRTSFIYKCNQNVLSVRRQNGTRYTQHCGRKCDGLCCTNTNQHQAHLTTPRPEGYSL